MKSLLPHLPFEGFNFWSRRRAATPMALALLLGLGFGLNSGTAKAQVACDGSAEFPCGFQLQTVELQPVPRTIKFQARVSQAKLPIGEGLFNRVVVNLKRGDETLCREEFRDVIVSSSVVNLELGRNMSCELDQVVAENPELLFQLCIGGPDNCLRPVAFGTAPYAMKSSFAQQSQYAHQADVAGQANYSHRATADRDMFRSKELGKGYFDFHTPSEAPELYPEAAFNTYRNGGFLQWTPMQESEPTLHISGKSPLNDLPVPLARLVLAATATDTTGRLNVRSGGVHVTGASEITGNTVVRGQLKVERTSSTGPQGIHAEGHSSITGKLGVSDRLSVDSGGAEINGGLTVKGDSSFSDRTDFNEAVVNGRLRVNGTLELPGDVDLGGVSSDFTVGRDFITGRDALVMGDLAVQGKVVAGSQGVALSSGSASSATTALARSGSKLVVNPGEAHTGGTEVDGNLSVNGHLVAETVSTPNGGMVPKGAIIMWSGKVSEIPSGWALCNGQNGTPDLMDRFILGVSQGEDPGSPGGSHNRTLSVQNLPAHSHTGTTEEKSHSHTGTTSTHTESHSHPLNYRTLAGYWISGGYLVASPGGQQPRTTDPTTTSHSHSFTTNPSALQFNFTTNNTGGNQPFDNRPAYYKLAFIMKL